LKGLSRKGYEGSKIIYGFLWNKDYQPGIVLRSIKAFLYKLFIFYLFSFFLPFFFSSLCNSHNHFIPWLIPSIWALNTHLELTFKSWQSLFRVILKRILCLAQKGYKRFIFYFFFWIETRPYIISNHDCFIFKRLTLKQNSMTSNTCQFFFFSFFSFSVLSFA